jgi:flagellar basal body rod protein FlgG
MIKGIYRSASGMLPNIKKQEAIANNVANAGTTGFKKDVVFSRELSKAQSRLRPKQTDWQSNIDSWVSVDHAPGVFDRTSNPLDLALEGDGFFALQSPEGNTVLTRSGSFVVDSEGYLAFPGGYRLLGDGGPIQVGNGELNIGQNGEVEVDGLLAGNITPQSLDDLNKLQRLGGSLFAVPQGEETIPPLSYTIRQGYLETSNVDVVNEMVDMLVAYRTYEANAVSLQTQDESLEHLMKKVGG